MTKGAVPVDILYVGRLRPVQRGGSGILGVELLTGLAGLGHRIRALAPCTAETRAAAARFDAQHAEVQTTWFSMPARSSDLLEGSRDAAYHLRIYACDYDLARTWRRWPMTRAERRVYYDAYRRHRNPSGFADHFAHWAVIVLVEAICTRLRTRTGGARHLLARLRDLLASGGVPAEDHEAAPAGRR